MAWDTANCRIQFGLLLFTALAFGLSVYTTYILTHPPPSTVDSNQTELIQRQDALDQKLTDLEFKVATISNLTHGAGKPTGNSR